MVVDAGGGTVDLSAYDHSTEPGKMSFEEVTSPQCTCPTVAVLIVLNFSLPARSLQRVSICHKKCIPVYPK